MHTLGRILGIGTAALAVIALTACGSSDDSDDTTAATSPVQSTGAAASTAPAAKTGKECTAEDIGVTGDFGTAPKITIPDTCDPPTHLIVKDLSEGDGPAAESGQQLTMNYALVTWSDRQTLDSSFQRGEPFPLSLGAGQVIPGWDQGLIGVKEGSRRLLIVPPELGYGQGGNGVAPNETLVFVTDAVKVGN
ncbi:FKBP-type peptidyl-prolyl cis-trans isomerase [Nocardia callitridis]|uniref:Peptidyl-prolyl cis-trans isomerase n=1 Tax=Nocardia callitridis TaxID=648753 RepID=A0ABP9L1W6_9NOCA